MADRKRPVKKKVTKKIKKLPKPEEKIREKLKEKTKEKKLPCQASFSLHSLTKRRSAAKQEKTRSAETSRSRRSVDSYGSTSSRKHKSADDDGDDDDDDDDEPDKLTNELSVDNLGKKKSKDISYHREEHISDTNLLSKKMSKQLSQRQREDELLKKKSKCSQREYSGDDLLVIKKSKGLSYRQMEELKDVKDKKSAANLLHIKKSKEYAAAVKSISHASHVSHVSSHKRVKDETSLHKQSTYKNIRNKRSSRISLAGIYEPVVREEGGAQKSYKGPNKFDYVARADHARTNLKLAIAWMEVCGVAFLTLMFAYGFSDDVAATFYFQADGELNGKLSHFALASFWIFIAGNAMILFRLFNQSKVRSIKYFHLTFHALGFLTVCLSLHAYSIFWKFKQISEFHNYSIHSKLGIFSMCAYLIAFSLALTFYSLKMFSQRFRAKFYHYHSFFGFVVFFSAVAAVCTGLIMEEKFKRLGYSTNRYTDKWLPKVAGIACILFSGGVLFVIIYPYFDFEKDFEEI